MDKKIGKDAFIKFIDSISRMRPTDFMGLAINMGVELYDKDEDETDEQFIKRIGTFTAEDQKKAVEERFKNKKARDSGDILDDVLNKYKELGRQERRKLDKIVEKAAKEYQEDKKRREKTVKEIKETSDAPTESQTESKQLTGKGFAKMINEISENVSKQVCEKATLHPDVIQQDSDIK